MAVRAKFRCDRMVTEKYDGQTSGYTRTTVHLSPVTGKDSEYGENERFHAATPNGHLEMVVDNPAALAQFRPGKSYYLDFTPAAD